MRIGAGRKLESLLLDIPQSLKEPHWGFRGQSLGSKLVSLNLQGNDIWDEGAVTLANGLKSSSLEILEVGCWIQDVGARALASSLKDSSLTELNLLGNCVGYAGRSALAASLRNSFMTVLRLYGDYIEDAEALELLNAIRDSGVINLNRCGRDCREEIRQAIEAALEANRGRSFVLQMAVESAEAVENGQAESESEWRLIFRTAGGTQVAAFNWSNDRPVRDLPKAVWTAVRSSAERDLCRSKSLENVRIVLPSGSLLETGFVAAPLAVQLEMPNNAKRRRLN